MSGDGVRARKELLVKTIEQHWEEHGFAPTRDELAELTGLSRRTVQTHVAALLQEGTLTEEPGKARTLRVWF